MRYFIFLAILALAQPMAFADDGTNPAKSGNGATSTLPEVVVKAKELKSLAVASADEAEESLNKVPGGTDLIRAEEYKKGRASTLQDALGYSPGVFVQPRFGSEEARLSIRGSGLQRTFHLRGIKLLQDGVPINQADGGGDFQVIEPLALQYLEVYRGANALQYGATTLGGAINFVSPTGYDADLIQARFEIGSFNYLRDQVSSGAVVGPFDYFVSLYEFRQDGFRNHSDQWTRRLFSNYGIRLSDQVETRFYLNLVDSKSKLPGNLTKAQMRQNPKQNAAANVTGNQKRDFDLVHLASKATGKWDDQTAEFSVFWIRKDLFHPIFQVLDVLSNDFGASLRYLSEKKIFDRKNILTLGINPVWGIVDDLRHTNLGGERGVRTAESRQHSYNVDLYAEDQFYLFEKLALVGGTQWSFASRRTRDKFLQDGNHSGHPTYQAFSPKVGFRYEFTEQTQIFANYSRSFEPPSFGELSNVTGGGIRDLKAQEADTVEIGTRGRFDRISWDLAYYYAWVENELLSLNDGEGNPLGTVNAYGTRHQGIELGAGFDLLQGILAEAEDPSVRDWVVLRGIYNWSRFRFSDDPAFSDNPLPGIPEHFMRAELVYEHPSGIYAGPNLEWSFKQYPVDMNNTLFADRYTLLGVKGGYRTKKGISFFVEGRNLTNEIYASTAGIINDAGGRDSAQFLPGDGRSVYAGMEFRWG